MRLAREFYYDVKPFLPFPFRLAMRRVLARIQLKSASSHWPIFPAAGTPPPDWSGWPEGKQFALVLTHDVESGLGARNCEALMRLEMKCGFRSSFNFIPEGSYSVSRELIELLKQNGFEVGVHDLHHNGKLYRSRKLFDRAVPRINFYLREWEAVGFRSGFMHRNLEWLHALDIEYDMSTFDTDPFEPQPDGAHTIFPFFVSNGSSRGYVELPYTLPQDSTLFLLLNQKDISIWKRKLDWVAERGGMALVNVHPDYIHFGDQGGSNYAFPFARYEELLEYVRDTYSGRFCCMLPKEVAAFVKQTRRAYAPVSDSAAART